MEYFSGSCEDGVRNSSARAATDSERGKGAVPVRSRERGLIGRWWWGRSAADPGSRSERRAHCPGTIPNR